MPQPVVHWEIAGRNLPALREFYTQAFGWTIADFGPTYALVEPVAPGLGGGLMQTPDQAAPYVTVYVQVEDLDVALAEITTLGGATLVEPTAIDDQSAFAMFRDPEGNVVGLLRASGSIADPSPTRG